MRSLPRLFAAVLFPVLVLSVLAGCSGQPKAKTLTSIAVTPASPAHLKVGATQQFTATGTFSDGSTADITATVTWTSGTTATATISAAGLATGVAGGMTSITAAQGGVTSPGVTLTVITLASIAVTPGAPTIAVGATQQFTATGTYSDSSMANITTQATWACNPGSVATFSPTGATGGLATGAANGTCQVTATLGSVVSPSVTLTVGTGGTPVPVAVVIVQTNPTIPVGNVEDFSAKFKMSDGTLVNPTAAVTWSSGTTATATIIASSGVASGLAAGTSTITAASTGLTSGTTTLTVATAVTRFVYTISAQDGVTSGFAINSPAETLAPLPAIADFQSTPSQLVFEPSGQFAYGAGTQGKIDIFTVDPVSGKLGSSGLTSVAITSHSSTTNIAQSAVDPTGRYLYVLDGGAGLGTAGPSFVNAYSITKGNLTAIGATATPAGTGAAGIVVDPLGRFVYVTNGGATSLITGYSIGSNGALSPLASIGGPFTSLSQPQFPAIDPLGQFLFVPNNTGNTVSSFTIAANGALTFVNAATSTMGAFQAVVDPAGKFVFVSDAGDGTVASIPINSTPTAGTLGSATTTSTGLATTSAPVGIAIDRSGTLLSVVNNGENSLTLFGVANGVLTHKFVSETRVLPLFVSFYSGTAAPVIGPSNVFAANSGSANISGFTAVNTTGVLTAGTGSPTTGVAGNTFLTADYSGTFLYTSSPTGTKQVAAFGADPSTAALTGLTGSPFNLATSTDAPAEIAAEPSSRFFYTGDATGAVVEGFHDVSSVSPITPNGITSSLTSVNTIVGDPQGALIYALGTSTITPIFASGVDGTLAVNTTDVNHQAGTWASGAIDPSGHWLVALDSAGKTIQSFGITPIQVFTTPDGKLTAVGSALATAVAAPSSVTFDPQGRFVFVSDATHGTVTAFAFNESTGAVTATGKQTTVDATGTGKVSIDASGTYLYAAVTGNGGSVPSGVAAYKINSDGSLTAVAGSPFAAGAGTSGTSGVTVTSSVQ